MTTISAELEQVVLENSEYVAALEDVLAKAKRVVAGAIGYHVPHKRFLELADAIQEADLLK